MNKAIKHIGAWVCFFCGILFLSAQSEVDAFRYAGSSIYGTARAQAMGGAFSAVGADFSATSLNPAGLALYRRADFHFSTGMSFINSQVDYIGSTGEATNVRFGFPSVGYVMGKPLYTGSGSSMQEKESGLRSFAVSLGYNQIANYNRDIEVQAFNNQNSIAQHFAERAQGENYNDLVNTDSYEALAAYSRLIDTAAGPANYFSSVPGGNVTQTLSRRERGRNNEWTIGVAGNFDDFIYFGGAVGIQSIRYESTLNYYEEDLDNYHNAPPGVWTPDSTSFHSMEMTDQFTTRGSGLNARFGVILRPSDFFRLGISFQSPTLMNLTDAYDGSLYMQQDNDGTNYGGEFLNEGRFKYQLVTPYKVTAGGMFLYKKMGFISADFEITDYSSTKFNPSGTGINRYTFADENQAISALFNFAYNYRFGAEYRYDMFRFRGGYANYGSVLNEDGLSAIDFGSGNLVTIKGNRQAISGGLGIKQNNYYIDLAYVRDVARDRQVFYTVSNPEENGNSPEQIVTRTSNTVLMTIGFTF